MRIHNYIWECWKRIIWVILVTIIAPSYSLAENFDEQKNLLDILVVRGVLTEQDALQVQKSITEVPRVSMEYPIAKSFTLSLYTQLRYQFSYQKATEEDLTKTKSDNGAAIRRVIFVYNAQFNDTTNLAVALNLAESSALDSFYFRKKIDSSIFKGNLNFGIMKPDFNMESPAAALLKVPERSIVNSFWGGKDLGFDKIYHESKPNQCLAGNHLGFFWKGTIPFDERFTWGASITNAKNAHWYKLDQNIKLAYWWNVGYAVKNDKFDFRSGLNFGYSPNVSSVYNPQTNDKQTSESFGSTAYFIYQGEHLFLHGEASMSMTEHGRTISDNKSVYTTYSKDATPFGAFMIVGYSFDIAQLGIIEPVIRASFINTDGAGVAENNVIYSIKKSLNGYYDKVHSYYAGFNWYFDKLNRRNFKLAVGMEHYRFYDSPTSSQSKHCNVNVFISQLQVAF